MTEPDMSQVATSTEPGWRPDPSGRFEWRYWDGGWTNRVANSAAATAPPALPAAIPAALEAAPAPSPAGATQPVARVEPFGVATTTAPAAAPRPTRPRRSPWAVIVDFVRSFADQPESYHSVNARAPIPSDGRHENMMSAPPGNYGHAGFVALAACGIAVGAYLPWLSGTIGIASFHRSGFDQGLGLAYGIGTAALALSALLSVRMRVFKWLTMALALVMAGFVVRDLLETYDTMQTMNAARSVDANVGMGIWIMIVSVAIAMIAAVRLSEDQKIG
ncbi:MAG: hypothetical protein QOF40_2776 [Actinomycetota bacterium]|nr:hypothetical protein [Actinomycetota bacterium]